MKIPKAKITKLSIDKPDVEIVRSAINVGLLEMRLNQRKRTLLNFVRLTQKGEKQKFRQERRITKYYLKKENLQNEQKESYESFLNEKRDYWIYLEAVEHCLIEINRLVEYYHYDFVVHIIEEYHIDTDNSPKFEVIKKLFKEKHIYLSDIKNYQKMDELRRLCNDIKHAYYKEYSVSKTLQLKSFRNYDRKMLVDKVNEYFSVIPDYLIDLAITINNKYPEILREV